MVLLLRNKQYSLYGINKEAESYFNTSYAVGNPKNSLALTPFNVTGIVNDGKDIPTIYIDVQAIEQLVPNMWQVQSANIYWHMTNGLTTKQMYSALQDILKETRSFRKYRKKRYW